MLTVTLAIRISRPNRMSKWQQLSLSWLRLEIPALNALESFAVGLCPAHSSQHQNASIQDPLAWHQSHCQANRRSSHNHVKWQARTLFVVDRLLTILPIVLLERSILRLVDVHFGLRTVCEQKTTTFNLINPIQIKSWKAC
jgi:hypothetical protein